MTAKPARSRARCEKTRSAAAPVLSSLLAAAVVVCAVVALHCVRGIGAVHALGSTAPVDAREVIGQQAPRGTSEATWVERSRGRVSVRKPNVDVQPTGTSAGLEGTLEVRVVSPVDDPVPIALQRGSVELARSATPLAPARFEGLAEGTYLLCVDEPDGLVIDGTTTRTWHGPNGRFRQLVDVSGGSFVACELRFVLGASLAGAVRDAHGVTLPEQEVVVQDLRRPASVHRLRTDGQGAFLVQGLRPSNYGVAIPASGAGHLRGEAVERTLVAGESAWIELIAAKPDGPEGEGRSIVGRVESVDGAVDGLRLICSVGGSDPGRPPATRILARARSTADGRFRFPGLPPGDLYVAVDARESELCADGRRRRLHRPFEPRLVSTVGGDVDLGVLVVATSR